MLYLNVQSTFKDNNPEFSSVGSAVEFSESVNKSNRLYVPDAGTLLLERFNCNYTNLELEFQNNMSLQFTIQERDLIASYNSTRCGDYTH